MIKAKKKFGQNFLKDASVKDKIIKAIPEVKNIVEIGAGLGDLTRELLKTQAKITSYEIDSELIEILQSEFKTELDSGKFDLINADANEIWQSSSLFKERYFLVANLPYYVATKMILNALKDELCDGLIVMVQREVALKFSAKAGSSDYSALAVIAELFGGASLLFDVPPECFSPAPKVTSSVFAIFKKPIKSWQNGEYEAFLAFLKKAFASPRKKLAKNLGSEQLLNELNIKSNARPHELNSTLYLEIFDKLKVKNERNK